MAQMGLLSYNKMPPYLKGCFSFNYALEKPKRYLHTILNINGNRRRRPVVTKIEMNIIPIHLCTNTKMNLNYNQHVNYNIGAH